MLPPAYQSYFGQLANLDLQISRMAGLPDLTRAVAAAHEALSLMKREPALSANPLVPDSIQDIEGRLTREDDGDRQSALRDLSRLIQSLGTSPRPFLFIVQNAPDQRTPSDRAPQSEIRPLAPRGEVRKTALAEELIRHWDRGEHGKARDLLTYLLWSARDGNIRSLTELVRIAVSDHATISVNAAAIVEVMDAVGWKEFALKFIDPTYPLLVPDFDPSKRNNNLLIRLLGNPPASEESVPALTSFLRKRPSQDLWGFRKHAAGGLFALTSPAYGAVLPVDDYWKAMIAAWPVSLPVVRPSFFAPTKETEHRWDLFEDHVRTAFSVAENPEQPIELRREALACLWKGYGGLDSAARPLWTVVYFRSRDVIRNNADFGGLRQYLDVYEKDAGIFVEPETTAPASLDSEAPLKLLGRFASFTRSRARHLRVISGTDDGFGPSPVENLDKLTAVASALGTYGLHLEESLVSGVLKAALQDLSSTNGFDPRAVADSLESLRRSLYPLNPAAAVSAWLDATGLSWPSHRLPGGHRLEGTLALLRWIRDRENEPEEIKRESARRYWALNARFSSAQWSAVQPDIDAWWRHRLTEELPSALASQLRETLAAGAPRSWVQDLNRRPEAEADLRAFATSPLPGTRALAQKILQILLTRRTG